MNQLVTLQISSLVEGAITNFTSIGLDPSMSELMRL